MNGGQESPETRLSTESEPGSGYIDPYLLDLPTADPADLPVLTLDPLAIRAVRDREDPITAHRTRRNSR